MEKVKNLVRAGQACHIDSTTILPIERVVILASRGEAGFRFTAWKEPFALVIDDDNGLRAFGRDARPIPIEGVKKEVPDLDELLGKPGR